MINNELLKKKIHPPFVSRRNMGRLGDEVKYEKDEEVEGEVEQGRERLASDLKDGYHNLSI